MTKRPSKLSFKQTLSNIREDMTPIEKLFSYFIHNRVVDAISQTISRTVMRPIPIIVGALTALVAGITLYIVSVLMQYSWSGSEIIASFAAGWSLGMIYDYTLLLTKGRK